MLINDSEREDLEQAIRQEGYEVSDFIVSERIDELPKGKIGFVTGVVEIARISTRVVRTYNARNGSTWPAEFSFELENGLFN